MRTGQNALSAPRSEVETVMEEILVRIENILAPILQQMGGMQWSDYLDIFCVALVFYLLLPMLRSTGTMRIAGMILALFGATLLTDMLDMHTMNWLLNQVLAVGLIAVIVLFQPELRRILDRISNVRLQKFFGLEREDQEMGQVITQTVMACEVMSREHVGALIVFHRDTPLDEYLKTGTMIDAQVSEQLIRNIFFPKAALHDGAMIIRGGRVTAAGCVLPLSDTNRLSADLGTRHRAAQGMSEVSDAVVVVVSEETGAISVAVDSQLKRHLAPQTLERLLRKELCKDDKEQPDNLALRLRQKLKKEKGDGVREK